MGDHDLFFKHVFRVAHRAAGEIRSVVPASIVARLDLDRLTPVSGSFVSPELAERHADLVFRTRLDGAEAYVYFLLEHQSEPDPLMPFRMLEYIVRLWAWALREQPNRRTLPPVVPIVVHHGESGWTAPRQLTALVDGIDQVPAMRALLPELTLLVDDLVHVDDAALWARPVDAYARVAFFALRDARRGDALAEHMAAWAGELLRLAQADHDAALRYVVHTARDQDYLVLKAHVARVAPGAEEAMGTIAEAFEKRGIEKGRLDALREMLALQVRDRFGTVGEPIRERIDAADLDTLRRAVGRVLHVTAPEELFDA